MRFGLTLFLLLTGGLGGGPLWHAQAQGTAPRGRAVIGYDFGLHGLQATALKFPNLTGAGLTVSIKEESFDTTDIDFRGRIVVTPALSAQFSDHATTMATLLGGAGNLVSSSRGVVPGVRLAASSYNRLLPDSLPELRRLGVSIQNHSYGVGIERFYGPEALAYDRQVAREPTLLHVFSSGNSGDELTANSPLPTPYGTLTGEFKAAKNVLVVGGISGLGDIEPRSSAGPTADGRIRPELVAYGNNGTSESAALVSGVAALLQQTYRAQTGQLPTAAWVRACLVASCQDLGAPGPDHRAGFGSLNAVGAVTLAQNRQYKTGIVSLNNPQSVTLTVPPGTARLSVALAWTDTPTATGMLRQNLDLWLEAIDTGELIRPWTLPTAIHPDSVRQPARRGLDRVNNVEQVSLANPAPGRYRIWVDAASLPDGLQAFSVAYSLDSTMTWFAPTAGAALVAGQSQPLRWYWTGNASQRGTLAVQIPGNATWQPVATNVRLSDQVVFWTPPSRNGPARLRFVTDTQTFLSDTFALVRPVAVRVLLNCPDRALVSWPRQPDVTAWQVYRLGSQYLEPLRLVTDTVAFLTPADGPFVAVRPIIAGQPRQAGYTIDYRRQGVGCYVTNWLARQLVSDTVRLDLTLSTAWNLRSLTLERATTSSVYTALQIALPAPGQTRYTFTDRPPMAGATRYRIRLTTQAGETVLTDDALVYGVRGAAPVVFPNPVAAGELLYVAGTDDEITATWLGTNGQTSRSLPLTGVIKQLPTDGLPPGRHLLRLDGPGGRSVVPVVVR